MRASRMLREAGKRQGNPARMFRWLHQRIDSGSVAAWFAAKPIDPQWLRRVLPCPFEDHIERGEN